MTGATHDLVDWLAARPGERILDAGCGLGAGAVRMVAAGALVTAVDRNSTVLEQARRAAPGAEYHCANVLAWQCDEPFDAILAAGLLHWLAPPDYGLTALRRLLRAGGRLLAETGGTGAPALDPATLRAAFERAGFVALELLPAPEGRIRMRAWRPEQAQ